MKNLSKRSILIRTNDLNLVSSIDSRKCSTIGRFYFCPIDRIWSAVFVAQRRSYPNTNPGSNFLPTKLQKVVFQPIGHHFQLASKSALDIAGWSPIIGIQTPGYFSSHAIIASILFQVYIGQETSETPDAKMHLWPDPDRSSNLAE